MKCYLQDMFYKFNSSYYIYIYLNIYSPIHFYESRPKYLLQYLYSWNKINSILLVNYFYIFKKILSALRKSCFEFFLHWKRQKNKHTLKKALKFQRRLRKFDLYMDAKEQFSYFIWILKEQKVFTKKMTNLLNMFHESSLQLLIHPSISNNW